VILVDSTVWIDLLRGQRSTPVATLERLLELGEAAVAPVIVQEILQGASSPKSLERLRTHFLALPMLEPRPGAVTQADAGALYARCRWAGATPRSPHDCLIATLAVAPDEAQPPLVADADAVLAGTVAVQRFEPVRRRYSQVAERHRVVQALEAHLCPPQDVGREAPYGLFLGEWPRSALAVALDHKKELADVVDAVSR